MPLTQSQLQQLPPILLRDQKGHDCSLEECLYRHCLIQICFPAFEIDMASRSLAYSFKHFWARPLHTSPVVVPRSTSDVQSFTRLRSHESPFVPEGAHSYLLVRYACQLASLTLFSLLWHLKACSASCHTSHLEILF